LRPDINSDSAIRQGVEYLHYFWHVDFLGSSKIFSAIILIDKNHEYDTVALNVAQLQHHKLKPRDGCFKPPKVKFEKSVAGCGI
jgi:hypothetical protein